MQEERPDAYAYKIFLSQTMVDIILQDGKSIHNCHAPVVNFYSGYIKHI
jgi:hypothetical protein